MSPKQNNPDSRTADAPLLDEQAVRDRAYEISQTEEAGTPEENWCRAEEELRAAADVEA